MDAVKKTKLERQIVFGLAVVFGVIFAMGPMKSLGLFNQILLAPPEPQEKVNVSKPIGAIFREQMQLPIPEEPQSVTSILTKRQLAPAYTANELRNPLKNLFPEKPAVPIAQGNPLATLKSAVPPPPPPPPALRIRGIVWGGSEPKALINDRVYGVGSEVAGVKILAITHQGVTIDYLGTPTLYPADSNLQHPAGGLSQQAQEWR